MCPIQVTPLEKTAMQSRVMHWLPLHQQEGIRRADRFKSLSGRGLSSWRTVLGRHPFILGSEMFWNILEKHFRASRNITEHTCSHVLYTGMVRMVRTVLSCECERGGSCKVGNEGITSTWSLKVCPQCTSIMGSCCCCCLNKLKFHAHRAHS